MLPQNSLKGANASTSVPQSLQAPPQLNANAMNNQVQKSQLQGVPAAQAVSQAAANPVNKYYAKGGHVTEPLPPSKSELDAKFAPNQLNQDDLKDATRVLQGAVALKPMGDLAKNGGNEPSPQPQKPQTTGNTGPSDPTENMFKSYFDKQGQAMMNDRANMITNGGSTSGYAKGGPTSNTKGKSTPSAHGRGLLAMNDDVGTYAQGGSVNSGDTGETDNEVTDNSAGMSDGKAPAGHSPNGLMKMASGGNVEDDLQSGSIQGYAPDGTPIVQDANGSESEASINDELDRPAGAPTLGTGATPTSKTGAAAGNSSAANVLGGNGTMSQMMAKGGEEDGPPPGSNSNEVADNIPAKLSEGEFVFSADTTRFYGLRTLNMLQEHARQELDKMNDEGTIRHPGDNGDQQSGGQFLQDTKPNTNAYPDKGQDAGDEDKVSGLLAECSGGGVSMATGGGVGEEQSLRSGGSVYGKDQYPVGRDNMVSAHPKGGAVAQDYKVGGVVSPKGPAMQPKTNPNIIPTGEAKIPGLKKAFSGVNALPKFKKGGLVNYNSEINKETTQSSIGA